jgi:hypothetical protein
MTWRDTSPLIGWRWESLGTVTQDTRDHYQRDDIYTLPDWTDAPTVWRQIQSRHADARSSKHSSKQPDGVGG